MLLSLNRVTRKLIRTCDLQSFTGKGKCTSAQAENFMRQIATFCNKTSWYKTHMIYGKFLLCLFGVLDRG